MSIWPMSLQPYPKHIIDVRVPNVNYLIVITIKPLWYKEIIELFVHSRFWCSLITLLPWIEWDIISTDWDYLNDSTHTGKIRTQIYCFVECIETLPYVAMCVHRVANSVLLTTKFNNICLCLIKYPCISSNIKYFRSESRLFSKSERQIVA